MSFGITKTIPAKEGKSAVEQLYDGSISEFEFHMAGKPSKLREGDFVYTISNNHIVGRIQIKKLIPGATNPISGKPRTLIIVKCPGEKASKSYFRKGHRGTRYYDGSDWE